MFTGMTPDGTSLKEDARVRRRIKKLRACPGTSVDGGDELLSRLRRRLVLLVIGAWVGVSLASPVSARKKEPPPEPVLLGDERPHSSGAFFYRIPGNWTVADVPSNRDAVQVAGDGIVVRFVYSPGEAGYDGLHVLCMMERLHGKLDSDPAVRYEYDFVGTLFGTRRALDSAFTVAYEAPADGHQLWRQRNLTVVGGGHSLCMVGFVPEKVWKKSPKTRALMNAVLESVRFRE
jgi:hypothetical protein